MWIAINGLPYPVSVINRRLTAIDDDKLLICGIICFHVYFRVYFRNAENYHATTNHWLVHTVKKEEILDYETVLFRLNSIAHLKLWHFPSLFRCDFKHDFVTLTIQYTNIQYNTIQYNTMTIQYGTKSYCQYFILVIGTIIILFG